MRILILFLFAFHLNNPTLKCRSLAQIDSLDFTKDPIELWKRMRPQDFAGEMTIWQVIV